MFCDDDDNNNTNNNTNNKKNSVDHVPLLTWMWCVGMNNG